MIDGHKYFHSTKLFDQISYFHGKHYKSSDQLCPDANYFELQFGNIQINNNKNDPNIKLSLISVPKCKEISYGFQTTYNLRSGRFSQRKHYFPKHNEWQDLLEARDFYILQIGYFLWFFGGFRQPFTTFVGAAG